jgi:hypothetical protein
MDAFVARAVEFLIYTDRFDQLTVESVVSFTLNSLASQCSSVIDCVCGMGGWGRQ